MPDKINPADKQIKKVLDSRQRIFDRIAAKGQGALWLDCGLADVRKAVVINSASRSGSSLLYAVLKKSSLLYSLAGEAVPFYKLNGFSSDISLSDRVIHSAVRSSERKAGLSRDILSDLSSGSRPGNIFIDKRVLDEYIDDLALRFPLQWPRINFSYVIFRECASRAFRKYSAANAVFNKERFYLELIRCLIRKYPLINPYYYDIRQEAVKAAFPGIPLPQGPPNDPVLIEEPPFILLSPRTKPAKTDLKDNTLFLKSTVDCYNMPFLRQLLPNADIKIIHLTRNPFGSVNGLYDGWLFRGFFSRNLKRLCSSARAKVKELNIRGYSDKYEWGKWWWKYDLPEDWQDYAGKTLEEVCAFQWYSANKAIQDHIRGSGKINSLQVKYENIISGKGRRLTEVKKIFDFIGLDKKGVGELELDELPVIQATKDPKPYRWKARERLLTPLLKDKRICRMARSLGYDIRNTKEWF
jgi:hypothetical protein